jgi:hypothetical protein
VSGGSCNKPGLFRSLFTIQPSFRLGSVTIGCQLVKTALPRSHASPSVDISIIQLLLQWVKWERERERDEKLPSHDVSHQQKPRAVERSCGTCFKSGSSGWIPKRWCPATWLHRIRKQKTTTWIFIALKTSSLAADSRFQMPHSYADFLSCGFFPGGKAAGAWSWPLTSI